MIPLRVTTKSDDSSSPSESAISDLESSSLEPLRLAVALHSQPTPALSRLAILLQEAISLGHSSARFREAGDETSANKGYRLALQLVSEALTQSDDRLGPLSGEEQLLICARLALDGGDPSIARRIARQACDGSAISSTHAEWAQLNDITKWSDAWLIAAVRQVTPDKESLDELARRHWQKLFGRCYLLTVNRENAMDLAQEAWFRVLKYRQALKPSGNFPAYIAMVATSLWRDRYRRNQRLGVLGETSILSLDAEWSGEAGETHALWEIVPDLASLEIEQELKLEQDVDSALAALPPILRAVLIARFIDGESCATIGQRFRRTEQSISGWIRRGIREMRTRLKPQ
jgi:RNA polymerase sigma-70 factor (ECF subfamily)